MARTIIQCKLTFGSKLKHLYETKPHLTPGILFLATQRSSHSLPQLDFLFSHLESFHLFSPLSTLVLVLSALQIQSTQCEICHRHASLVFIDKPTSNPSETRSVTNALISETVNMHRIHLSF